MLNEYYLTDDIEEPVLAHAVLSYVTPSISGKQFHELKTGQIHWDAKLDLSGLQAEDARKALLKFIQKQIKNKKYSLLIIHGTESRKNAFPLLKNLINHWLPQIAEVAAFHSANPKDGGINAVYVLLKKIYELPELSRIEKESILVAETKAMERQRRLAEQQGERRLASVKAREHSNQEAQPSPEGELQNSILQHPELNSQRFDGVDSALNPEPPLNTEARREFDNERRNQEQEKQLRLGHMPKFTNTPRPRGPQ
ncbi:putative Smr domain protein [Legionella sainthelensi]|uniref:DNA mismatch repair protein MutS n=1 Tax=Legionella sainthelensi TaxID=28087 RepID=A0A2H5FJZ8_9GAMM|nr:Smr/MutS family protein [Legionella sainthelensi]AUH71864.1 DNA mismatch repair protein MutS [Legionella sainthelensi]VEB33736.1 putative Smr domain protein [Legionella sainthelensi]